MILSSPHDWVSRFQFFLNSFESLIENNLSYSFLYSISSLLKALFSQCIKHRLFSQTAFINPKLYYFLINSFGGVQSCISSIFNRSTFTLLRESIRISHLLIGYFVKIRQIILKIGSFEDWNPSKTSLILIQLINFSTILPLSILEITLTNITLFFYEFSSFNNQFVFALETFSHSSCPPSISPYIQVLLRSHSTCEKVVSSILQLLRSEKFCDPTLCYCQRHEIQLTFFFDIVQEFSSLFQQICFSIKKFNSIHLPQVLAQSVLSHQLNGNELTVDLNTPPGTPLDASSDLQPTYLGIESSQHLNSMSVSAFSKISNQYEIQINALQVDAIRLGVIETKKYSIWTPFVKVYPAPKFQVSTSPTHPIPMFAFKNGSNKPSDNDTYSDNDSDISFESPSTSLRSVHSNKSTEHPKETNSSGSTTKKAQISGSPSSSPSSTSPNTSVSQLNPDNLIEGQHNSFIIHSLSTFPQECSKTRPTVFYQPGFTLELSMQYFLRQHQNCIFLDCSNNFSFLESVVQVWHLQNPSSPAVHIDTILSRLVVKDSYIVLCHFRTDPESLTLCHYICQWLLSISKHLSASELPRIVFFLQSCQIKSIIIERYLSDPEIVGKNSSNEDLTKKRKKKKRRKVGSSTFTSSGPSFNFISIFSIIKQNFGQVNLINHAHQASLTDLLLSDQTVSTESDIPLSSISDEEIELSYCSFIEPFVDIIAGPSSKSRLRSASLKFVRLIHPKKQPRKSLKRRFTTSSSNQVSNLPQTSFFSNLNTIPESSTVPVEVPIQSVFGKIIAYFAKKHPLCLTLLQILYCFPSSCDLNYILFSFPNLFSKNHSLYPLPSEKDFQRSILVPLSALNDLQLVQRALTRLEQFHLISRYQKNSFIVSILAPLRPLLDAFPLFQNLRNLNSPILQCILFLLFTECESGSLFPISSCFNPLFFDTLVDTQGDLSPLRDAASSTTSNASSSPSHGPNSIKEKKLFSLGSLFIKTDSSIMFSWIRTSNTLFHIFNLINPDKLILFHSLTKESTKDWNFLRLSSGFFEQILQFWLDHQCPYYCLLFNSISIVVSSQVPYVSSNLKIAWLRLDVSEQQCSIRCSSNLGSAFPFKKKLKIVSNEVNSSSDPIPSSVSLPPQSPDDSEYMIPQQRKQFHHFDLIKVFQPLISIASGINKQKPKSSQGPQHTWIFSSLKEYFKILNDHSSSNQVHIPVEDTEDNSQHLTEFDRTSAWVLLYKITSAPFFTFCQKSRLLLMIFNSYYEASPRISETLCDMTILIDPLIALLKKLPVTFCQMQLDLWFLLGRLGMIDAQIDVSLEYFSLLLQRLLYLFPIESLQYTNFLPACSWYLQCLALETISSKWSYSSHLSGIDTQSVTKLFVFWFSLQKNKKTTLFYETLNWFIFFLNGHSITQKWFTSQNTNPLSIILQYASVESFTSCTSYRDKYAVIFSCCNIAVQYIHICKYKEANMYFSFALRFLISLSNFRWSGPKFETPLFAIISCLTFLSKKLNNIKEHSRLVVQLSSILPNYNWASPRISEFLSSCLQSDSLLIKTRTPRASISPSISCSTYPVFSQNKSFSEMVFLRPGQFPDTFMNWATCYPIIPIKHFTIDTNSVATSFSPSQSLLVPFSTMSPSLSVDSNLISTVFSEQKVSLDTPDSPLNTDSKKSSSHIRRDKLRKSKRATVDNISTDKSLFGSLFGSFRKTDHRLKHFNSAFEHGSSPFSSSDNLLPHSNSYTHGDAHSRHHFVVTDESVRKPKFNWNVPKPVNNSSILPPHFYSIYISSLPVLSEYSDNSLNLSRSNSDLISLKHYSSFGNSSSTHATRVPRSVHDFWTVIHPNATSIQDIKATPKTQGGSKLLRKRLSQKFVDTISNKPANSIKRFFHRRSSSTSQLNPANLSNENLVAHFDENHPLFEMNQSSLAVSQPIINSQRSESPHHNSLWTNYLFKFGKRHSTAASANPSGKEDSRNSSSNNPRNPIIPLRRHINPKKTS